MMKSLLTNNSILPAFVFLFFASTCLAKDGTIIVNIPNTGKKAINVPIRACLSKGKNCLKNRKKAIQEITGYSNNSGYLKLEFHDIPFGRYAVYVYHDRNKDKNFQPYRIHFGRRYPFEWYGISNNPLLRNGDILHIIPPQKRRSIHLVELGEKYINIRIQLKPGMP